MPSLGNTERPAVHQEFHSADRTPLRSVQVRPMTQYGDLEVLWCKVQDAFAGIDHLNDKMGNGVLFDVVDGEST
ncbi:hypothetical protein BGZ52_005315, partial [Haplosporangium bisporale]